MSTYDNDNNSTSGDDFVPSLDELMGDNVTASATNNNLIITVMRQGKNGKETLSLRSPASIQDIMGTLDWDFEGHSFMVQKAGARDASFASVASPDSYRFTGSGSGEVDYTMIVTPRVSGGTGEEPTACWSEADHVAVRFYKF